MLDASYGGIFSYADEAVTIVLVIWALFTKSKDRDRKSKNERVAIGALVALCGIGLLGNLAFGYQVSFFAIAVDLFTCIKIFIAFFASRIVLRGKERCLGAFRKIGKLFLLMATCGLILHVVGIVQLGSGRITFGIPCYQFLFSHPTNLAAYCVGFASLMFIDEIPKRGWLVLSCLLLVSTQRAKAIAMAFIILFFLFYGVAKKDDRKPSKGVFVFLGIGAIVLGADQIQEYFLTSTAARSLLLQDGIDVAFRCFPLGSGFATFATYMSGMYYSPLYYDYGLNNVWGLYPSNPVYVSDTFWPALIAQFGLLGLIVFFVVAIFTFRTISFDSKSAGIRFAAYGTIPLYLLILSTSDASFFNFYGPFYALILGAITNISPMHLKNAD